MILDSLFDILRGFPNEGAIAEVFPIHKTGPSYDSIGLGMVVAVQSDGSVAIASTPDRSTTDAVPVWVVIEGNSDFSGTFLEKAVCLRSNAQFRLDPANLNAGSYTPGTALTFSSGKWQPAATHDQVIGHVLVDNTATDGSIVVQYTGGDTAKV